MDSIMALATVIILPKYITFGTKALKYPDYYVYFWVITELKGVVVLMYPNRPAILMECVYAGLTLH